MVIVNKHILVNDLDNGVIWARFDKELQTKEGPIELYIFIEYYHSLKEAVKDLYDIDLDE